LNTPRDESLFLYETRVTASVGTVLTELVTIHNGRRKVLRIAAEVRKYIEGRGQKFSTVRVCGLEKHPEAEFLNMQFR
jgi:hypothetical protein